MNNLFIVQGQAVEPNNQLQTAIPEISIRKEALRIARQWWDKGERDFLTRYHNPDWSTCLKRGWSIAKKQAEQRRIAEKRKSEKPFQFSHQSIKSIEDGVKRWSDTPDRSAWS